MRQISKLLVRRMYLSVLCSVVILIFFFACFRIWNNFVIQGPNVKTIVARSIIGCLRVQKANSTTDCKLIFESIGEITPEVLVEVWVFDSSGTLIWQNTNRKAPEIEGSFGQALNYTANNGINLSIPVPGGYIDDIESQKRVIIGNTLDGNPLNRKRRMFVLFALALVVLATMISSFFSFLVLSRRAKEAKRVLHSLTEGDLTARFKVGRLDELSELSSSFNQMVNLLAKSLQEIKISEEGRKSLIGELSHDLRTPLTSMTSFIQILQENPRLRNGIERECIDSISTEINYLDKLMGNLFELSKIESPQTKAERVRMNLSLTLREVESLFSLVSTKSTIAFNTDLKGEEAWILGDAVLARRMLCNLIENSLRFAKSTVSLKSNIDYGLQCIRIEIIDDGIGFSEDQIKNFGLVPAKRNVHLGSDLIHMGLGLVITMKIVNLHEGKLYISNLDSGGARAEILIPLLSPLLK